MTETTWTIARALAWTQAYLGRHGSESPRLDTEVLLAHVLATERIQLYVQHERPLDKRERERFRDLVRRRASGEPVAYLTGFREFWSLRMAMTPAVLIARPETEVLVEQCLALWRDRNVGFVCEQPKILELGVGSGAVAAVLAKELPEATVFGVDISAAALEVARSNVAALGVAQNVTLLEGDLFQPVAAWAPFDLVVSNPPYIPSAEIESLQRDVARYEPRMALDGGPDGLRVIGRILDLAPGYVRPDGWLALEIGTAEQAQHVRQRMSRDFDDITVRNDYAGRPRVVRGRRKG